MKLSTVHVPWLLCFSLPAFGQGQTAADWTGTWQAEGTLFQLAVHVNEGILSVEEMESVGFVWSATTGVIEGNQVTLTVQSQGVTAEVVAEVTGEGRAVVRALSCMPEYMVACTLTRDRKATFLRLEAP